MVQGPLDGPRSGFVEVTLRDGRRVNHFTRHPPGTKENPLTAYDNRYAGAILLVTHDEGAVHALEPDRVLILPDGVEDLWTPDYADLISLA